MFRYIPFVARYLSRHEKIKTPRPDGPVVQKRKIRKPEINSTCPVTEGYLATIYDNRPFRIRPATAQVPTFSNYVIQDVKKKICTVITNLACLKLRQRANLSIQTKKYVFAN